MPTQMEMLEQISREVAMFDLVLKVKTDSVVVDEHFDVQLWAFTQPGDWRFPTSLGVLHVLLQWDPAVFDLVTHVTNLLTNPVMAAFPRLGIVTSNDDLHDGNALYMMYPNFGADAIVPSSGLHIATFKFKALAAGAGKVQIGDHLPGGRIGDNTRNATWLRHPEFGTIAGRLSFLNRRIDTPDITVLTDGVPEDPMPDIGQSPDPSDILQRIIEWLSIMVEMGQPIKPEQFQTLVEQVSTIGMQTGRLTADPIAVSYTR